MPDNYQLPEVQQPKIASCHFWQLLRVSTGLRYLRYLNPVKHTRESRVTHSCLQQMKPCGVSHAIQHHVLHAQCTIYDAPTHLHNITHAIPYCTPSVQYYVLKHTSLPAQGNTCCTLSVQHHVKAHVTTCSTQESRHVPEAPPTCHSASTHAECKHEQ